jgi:hypothetical protein
MPLSLRYFHTVPASPNNRRHIRSPSQETGSPTRIKDTMEVLCVHVCVSCAYVRACVCVCARARVGVRAHAKGLGERVSE